jgi:hypothetical protein
MIDARIDGQIEMETEYQAHALNIARASADARHQFRAHLAVAVTHAPASWLAGSL